MTVPTVVTIAHPMIQHKLTLMRDKTTPSNAFRHLLREISLLMGYEVLQDLEMEEVEIETPLETMKAPIVGGKKLCLISILRAGNGLLEGILDLVPSARVGHIGLYRDPKTLEPVEYYWKVPERIDERLTIVVDPMLATGNSAAAAVAKLKERGAQQIRFVCLLAAPEGIAAFHGQHPEVPIYTCAVDRKLNEKGYILPGLGDAGDRLYGTK